MLILITCQSINKSRFYDLNQGQLLINGVDVHDVEVAAVRKRFSLVSQEPTLYQGTTPTQ